VSDSCGVAFRQRILYRPPVLLGLWGAAMRTLAVGTVAAVGGIFAVLSGPAVAAQMQPGMWRFTQTTVGASGRERPSRTTRCVPPAEAADPVRFFAPRSDGSCELIENSSLGSRISSRMRCTIGQATREVVTAISFDGPARMTMTTTVATSAGGKSASASVRGEGVRTGDCR
jgi:Protein of unknown function (DUF3617)